MHVIIITNDEREYQALVSRLAASNMAVHGLHVRDKETLKAALAQEHWNLVLCDYSVPQLRPAEALQIIQEGNRDIPFIVLADNINVEMAVDMMKRGAQDFLLREELSRLGDAVVKELALGVVREEKRQAQLRLEASEKQFRTLFEHAPIGILEADVSLVKQKIEKLRQQGVTVFAPYLQQSPQTMQELIEGIKVRAVNERLKQILCFRQLEELTEWMRREALYERPEIWRQFFARLMAGETQSEMEGPYKRLDGKEGYMLVRAVVMPGSELDLSRVLAFFVDITERQRMEQKLARQREQLAVILQSVEEGIIATDKTGHIELLNPQAEKLTGWSQNEAQGRPVADILPLADSRTGESIAAKISAAIAGAAPTQIRGQITIPEGLKITLECHINPLRNKANEIVGAVLVLRDVSDEERRQQEIIHLEKITSLELLAGGLAHNFNNLLTAISHCLQMAQVFPERDPRRADMLYKAQEACQRAQSLIQQLLTFAKGGAPKKEITNLTPLVRDMAQLSVSGSKVKLEFAVAPDLWPVEVDSSQMAQVVNNLVLNAVQAMPAGGIVRVSLYNTHLNGTSGLAVPPGDYVALRVEDEGPGIPPELLERIFEPYFTTKEGGSGLGLTSCQSIVRQHGGEIAVYSEVGKGSVFTVFLPRCRQPLSPN